MLRVLWAPGDAPSAGSHNLPVTKAAGNCFTQAGKEPRHNYFKQLQQSSHS